MVNAVVDNCLSSLQAWNSVYHPCRLGTLPIILAGLELCLSSLQAWNSVYHPCRLGTLSIILAGLELCLSSLQAWNSVYHPCRLGTLSIILAGLELCLSSLQAWNSVYHPCRLGTLSRGRPWRYSVIPSTPDFPTEYQIRRHSNPGGLPTFAAIWGPDFRASIIRLTCPQVFKQIKI